MDQCTHEIRAEYLCQCMSMLILMRLEEQEILSGIALDYRVIHVCYQKSGEKHYPIETGRIMREKYESGLIRNTACNNQQANCVWRVCTLPLCGYRAGVSDYRQRTSFMRK